MMTKYNPYKDGGMHGSITIRILRALDQLLNTILLGNTDQTLSARSYEGRITGIKWCKYSEKILNIIFFWEPHHCEVSFFTDPTELTYTKKD